LNNYDGFFKASANKNIYNFEHEKGEKKILSSPKHFHLVKLSLDGVLPSRARLRFTLQKQRYIDFKN